jgi:signal peptidase II
MRGHVVDVVSLFDPNGAVWPVFNLADSCIVIGALLVVVFYTRGGELSGLRPKPAPEHDHAGADG